MSDFSSIFLWWLTILILGTIFLPTTTVIFRNFLDRGYIFSKVLAILIASFIVWILGSLSILPFVKLTIFLVLIACLLANLWLGQNLLKRDYFKKIPWSFFLLEEGLFLLGLSFWSYVRATEPSIRGLEKFMDFGFVNSILRGNFFPPLDMWLTKSPDFSGGYFINYYYFGHYVTAFLTKLTGIDSAITYNLMLATLFAFTFTLSFSIGMNLFYLFKSLLFITGDTSGRFTPSASRGDPQIKIKAILVGLLAAFLVALGGNLHTLYIFTSGYPNEDPVPPWKLSVGFHPDRYWYPNATRFIPFTIHEFPIYSFVVADLHGHVSDIPFVLFTLALLLTLITRPKQISNAGNLSSLKNFLSDFESHTSVSLLFLLLLGLLLSVMYMTNAWDGMIYLLLSGLVFLYLNFREKIAKNLSLGVFLYKTFSASLFLMFFFLVFNLPFSLNFRPFVSGIGVLCAPFFLLEKNIGPFLFETGKCQKSPFFMMATLWGFFYFNVIGFFIFVIFPCIGRKFKNWKFLPAGEVAKIENLSPIDIFVILVIAISTFLLVFPEFFYIKDIYPAHYRANTMFKLGYQAFMMLGLASSYIYFRIKDISERKFKFHAYKLLFFILFFLVAIYPYFAINSYYGGLKTYQGLYGLKWMETQYPDDYKGVEWLKKNVSGQPVIVEANGDSYTDYARVSAYTGMPTIIGWPVHEWLWRGSYDEAGRRIPEVETIYISSDINITKEILRKYNAQYIFVGTLEKEKYKELNEEKLVQLGRVVFESGETKIIKVNL